MSGIAQPWGPGAITGEPVAQPGTPDQYPWYLRDIPLTEGRDVERLLRQAVQRAQRAAVVTTRAARVQVQRWLYSSLGAAAQPVKYQEIRNALYRGEIAYSLIETVQEEYAAALSKALAPQWDRAAGSLRDLVNDGLSGSRIGPPVGGRVAEVMRRIGEERIATQVTNITQTTRDGLRRLIGYYRAERPVSNADLGRLVRPVVGLTRQQAAQVQAYAEELRGALQLEALAANPAAQAQYQRALEQYYRRTESYTGYLHRQRAELIAQTETTRVYAETQHALVEDAIKAMPNTARRALKVWRTAQNERVCEQCAPLDGEQAELDAPFSDGTFLPPVHPRCQCVVQYRLERQ
jgi:hypothetical protein